MTEIEKAKALWRLCANPAIPLSGSDRVQIANSFKAMIEKAEQAEGFEAFKREVSDVVVKATHTMATGKLLEASCILAAFILPKPVDPLVEAINDADDMVRVPNAPSYAEAIRAALAKRGLEVREIEK